MPEKACIAVNRRSKAILLNCPEGKDEGCIETPNLLREYLSSHEENVGRNMDDKSHSDEVSDENEDTVRRCLL